MEKELCGEEFPISREGWVQLRDFSDKGHTLLHAAVANETKGARDIILNLARWEPSLCEIPVETCAVSLIDSEHLRIPEMMHELYQDPSVGVGEVRPRLRTPCELYLCRKDAEHTVALALLKCHPQVIWDIPCNRETGEEMCGEGVKQVVAEAREAVERIWQGNWTPTESVNRWLPSTIRRRVWTLLMAQRRSTTLPNGLKRDNWFAFLPKDVLLRIVAKFVRSGWHDYADGGWGPVWRHRWSDGYWYPWPSHIGKTVKDKFESGFALHTVLRPSQMHAYTSRDRMRPILLRMKELGQALPERRPSAHYQQAHQESEEAMIYR